MEKCRRRWRLGGRKKKKRLKLRAPKAGVIPEQRREARADGDVSKLRAIIVNADELDVEDQSPLKQTRWHLHCLRPLVRERHRVHLR